MTAVIASIMARIIRSEGRQGWGLLRWLLGLFPIAAFLGYQIRIHRIQELTAMDYGLSCGWEDNKSRISKQSFQQFQLNALFNFSYLASIEVFRCLDLLTCSTINYYKKIMYCPNFFAGRSTRIQIDRLLGKLTPTCQVCNGKKEHICIEKNCMKKQPYVCITCDQQHKLHRKNQLRLLFLDCGVMQPISAAARNRIQDIKQFLREQKQKCQKQIEKITNLRNIFTRYIIELQNYKIPENWLQEAFQIVRNNVFKKKISKQTQEQFYNCLNKINLYQDPLLTIQPLINLKKQIRIYEKNSFQTTHLNTGLSQAIEFFERGDDQYSLEPTEKFILRTNIEQYIMTQKEINIPVWLDCFLIDTKNRSIQIYQIEQNYKIQAERVILDRKLYNLGQEVVQLHSRVPIVEFPPLIQSLSYLADVYVTNEQLQIRRRQANNLPVTLKKLRITQSNFNRMKYSLDKLQNLQYLVILDDNLTIPEKKKILKFSIQRNLRMLCLLQNPMLNQNSRYYEIEAIYTHSYPQLQKHFLSYKRKLFQVMLIARTKTIRKSYWAQNILHFAENNFEFMK